jgi:hypothetical protein
MRDCYQVHSRDTLLCNVYTSRVSNFRRCISRPSSPSTPPYCPTVGLFRYTPYMYFRNSRMTLAHHRKLDQYREEVPGNVLDDRREVWTTSRTLASGGLENVRETQPTGVKKTSVREGSASGEEDAAEVLRTSPCAALQVLTPEVTPPMTPQTDIRSATAE